MEILAVPFVPEAPGAVGPLVVLALVPEDRVDLMRQAGAAHAGQQPAVDRRGIGRVGLVALVLVDARAAHRPIDEADRHLVLFDDPLAELHRPIADLVLAARRAVRRHAPRGRLLAARRRAAERPDPFAPVGTFALAPIRRDRVGLAFHDEGAARHEVLRRVQGHLLARQVRRHRRAVMHEARAQADLEGVGVARGGFLSVGLAVGRHRQGHLRAGAVDLAGAAQPAQAIGAAAVELVVHRPLLGLRRPFRARYLGRTRHLDLGLGHRRGAAVVDRGPHDQFAVALGAQQAQRRAAGLLRHREGVRLPAHVQRLGQLRGVLRDHGHLEGAHAVPAGRGLQAHLRFGDRLAHRQRRRDLDRAFGGDHAGHHLHRGGVALGASGREAEAQGIRRQQLLAPLADQPPGDLAGAGRAQRQRLATALGHVGHRGRQARRTRAGGRQDAVQRLLRALVRVAELGPGRRAGDLRHAHLVDLADILIIVIPTADPEPGGGGDVHRAGAAGRHLGGFAVHVDLRAVARVHVHHVHPPARGERTALDVAGGEVAVRAHVRRAAVLQDHLALALFVAPADHAGVRLRRAEPDLGRVRLRARRETGDLVAPEDPRLARERPARADHAGRRLRPRILALEPARRIGRRVVEVPDRQVMVALVEDRGAIGRVRGVGLAPVQVQRLALLARQSRDPDPDRRRAARGVPRLDLVGQGLSLAIGEAQVLAPRLRLGERKPVALQAHQQGEALDRLGRRQVDPGGVGQDRQRAVAAPGRERAVGGRGEAGGGPEREEQGGEGGAHGIKGSLASAGTCPARSAGCSGGRSVRRSRAGRAAGSVGRGSRPTR